MKFALLCKRRYTNRDLLTDRFGRLYHLPERLGHLGHDGLVLAADYHSRQSDVLTLPHVRFVAFPLTPLRLIPFLWQVYDELKNFQPDVLIASGDTYLGYFAMHYAGILRIPFVFDIYDDYRVFASRKIPGMRKLFSRAVRGSSLIVASSRPLRDELLPLNKNCVIIENGVDTTLFRPISRKSARQILGLPTEETIIGFFGSIDPRRGVETLIDAVDMLRSDRPRLRLLIAGRNGMGLNLDRDGIDFRGLLPQLELPFLINACDVVVIPYHTDPQVDVSNACKIAEYIACNVPVVVTRVSNHADIFADAAQGLCDPGNPADMARAISRQLESPQRVGFSREMTWDSLAAKLASVLEEVCGFSPFTNRNG